MCAWVGVGVCEWVGGCVSVCASARMHKHTHTHTHTRTHACTYTYTHLESASSCSPSQQARWMVTRPSQNLSATSPSSSIRNEDAALWVRVCMCACVRVRVCANVGVFVCGCARLRVRAHTHTHMHAHTYTPFPTHPQHTRAHRRASHACVQRRALAGDDDLVMARSVSVSEPLSPATAPLPLPRPPRLLAGTATKAPSTTCVPVD